MGIDIVIVKIWGYCIKCTEWDEFVKAHPDAGESTDDGYQFLYQDNFGNEDGDACVLITTASVAGQGGKNTILSRPLGGTPMSIFVDQKMHHPHVTGGAKTYFSVGVWASDDIDLNTNEQKGKIDSDMPQSVYEFLQNKQSAFNEWIFSFYM